MTIRLVLVDHHNLLRESIAALIDAQVDLVVVGQASSLAGGQTLIAEGGADVLVVDVSMPDRSGLDLARSARSAHPALGIVVLTVHDDDDTLFGALDAGASALVLKSSSARDVLEAIRRAASAPDAFTATGLADAFQRRNNLPAKTPILTSRESQVFMRLVDGDNVTRVARQLFMSESTVKTDIRSVYENLGAHDRASAIVSWIRHGLFTH